MKSRTVLELALVVFIVGIGILSFTRPEITGYVGTNVLEKNVNLELKESQSLTLQADQQISGLSVSGTVIGNGTAAIYLNTGDEKKLVYSNVHEGALGNLITGHVIGLETITEQAGQANFTIKNQIKLDEVEPLLPGKHTTSGAFENTCIDTCKLDLKETQYNLEILIEPGTVVKLNRISLAVAQK